MIQVLVLVGATWALRETYIAFVRRRRERGVAFEAALSRSRELGVPLMVVGDPDSGFITKFFGRDYGCGDLCTDIVGCAKCPEQIQAPLEEALTRIPRESHVVYVSCTLEYVTDLERCIAELERVAVPGALFVVRVDPTHLSTFWFYTPPKWVLFEAPMGDGGGWLYAPYRSR